MLIEQIWTSAGHNYFNHHGRPPGAFPPVPHQRDEAPKRRLLRVSTQIYNDDADYDRLIKALSPRI